MPHDDGTPRWRALRDTVGPHNNIYIAGAEISADECPGLAKDWARVGGGAHVAVPSTKVPAMTMPQAGLTIIRQTPSGPVLGRRPPIHEQQPTPRYRLTGKEQTFALGDFRQPFTTFSYLGWPDTEDPTVMPANDAARAVWEYAKEHRGHPRLTGEAWDDANQRVNTIGRGRYTPSAQTGPKIPPRVYHRAG